MAVKNTWTTGERVTAADLNAMATLLNIVEQAIANIGELADPGLVGGPLLLTDTKAAARAVIEAVGFDDLGALAVLEPTGTADGTTFLRGDGVWATPPAGGGSGENHYLVYDAEDGWPTRPAGPLPVIWVGGDAPEDAPAEHVTGDVWIPATGDNIDLGTILEAFQLITGTANTIPYLSALNTFGNLALKTVASAYSDTAVLTEAATRDLVDKLPTQAAKTGNYSLVASDRNTCLEYDSAGAGTFTVDNHFAEGDIVSFRSINTGLLTIAAGTGVTLSVFGGTTFKLAGKWAEASIHFRTATHAILRGELIA